MTKHKATFKWNGTFCFTVSTYHLRPKVCEANGFSIKNSGYIWKSRVKFKWIFCSRVVQFLSNFDYRFCSSVLETRELKVSKLFKIFINSPCILNDSKWSAELPREKISGTDDLILSAFMLLFFPTRKRYSYFLMITDVFVRKTHLMGNMLMWEKINRRLYHPLLYLSLFLYTLFVFIVHLANLLRN